MSLLTKILPSWKNALLAILAAVLLILAFPDFEWWFTAWFALVPLMWAVEREKESVVRAFAVGWLFGTVFFFGTCWWLTFAPINYAGFPPWLAYSGMVFVAAAVGLFPALFAGILAVLLRRLGSLGFLAAPFVWVFTEFLRYWLTGNNWNAIGYSQAFSGMALLAASVGGLPTVTFFIVFPQSLVVGYSTGYLKTLEGYGSRYWGMAGEIGLLAEWILIRCGLDSRKRSANDLRVAVFSGMIVLAGFAVIAIFVSSIRTPSSGLIQTEPPASSRIVALQPNVPMSGLDYTKWGQLRQRQIDMAETAIKKNSETRTTNNDQPTLVILPESPMNFMYEDDREFQKFINDFARRNNVSVLFNSAEPDATNGKFFNSAVLVSPEGREAGQYDKIFLLPFGEAVPPPFDAIMPGFVGNFSYGREYDILPVGDAKAGVMICFESHFGQLARRFVADGADVLIEMTNDGYLGPTPVLRQHLANAVFRAVETNRPVLRVTNVGVTAYINEKGAVLDAAPTYQESTRVWSVSKSDGQKTFYVKYGDWFAWLCSVVTVGLLVFGIATGRRTILTTDEIG